VTVHLPSGEAHTYPFALSTMEECFLRGGGVERLYKQFRRELFKAVLKGPPSKATADAGCGSSGNDDSSCATTETVAAAVGAQAKDLAW
jgi:hypothetical protein